VVRYILTLPADLSAVEGEYVPDNEESLGENVPVPPDHLPPIELVTVPDSPYAPVDAHIEPLPPAFTFNWGNTVMVTDLDLVHPVAVTVSSRKYVAVLVGAIVGLEEEDVKPAGELVQE
jgi:hypothetical protein